MYEVDVSKLLETLPRSRNASNDQGVSEKYSQGQFASTFLDGSTISGRFVVVVDCGPLFRRCRP